MHVAALVLLGAAAALAQRPGHTPCVHGTPGDTAWTDDTALRSATLAQLPNRTTPSRHVLNLDLPAEQRWDEICKIYKPRTYIIHDYLKNSLGKLGGAMGIIEAVAARLDEYKGFGDYAAEMRGLSKACGLQLGDVVAGNLVYQLEGIGVNCSNWNNTGPTGQCGNKTGVVWMGSEDGPGACTSMVAEDANRQVFHGRNLDWNLPPQMRQFILDIEFQKGGETQFVGTVLLGGTGLVAGLKEGGFTFSNDARCQGGKLLENLATMLLFGAQTPSHHARRVYEQASTFDEAVKLFSTGDLIDEVYYIVGGAAPGEGAIITRDRLNTADVWRLGSATHPDAAPNSWFRLQTNYDHWEQPPSSDDRRTPGDAHMVALGQRGVGVAGLLGVLTTWPNFNHHTDYSSVMSAKSGLYNTTIWMGEGGGGGGGGGR